MHADMLEVDIALCSATSGSKQSTLIYCELVQSSDRILRLL